MNKPNIVILDGFVANPGDLSWDTIAAFGQLTVYDRTSDEELIDRAKEAEILIINKRTLSRDTLYRLERLQCICLLSTGYNSVDIQAAKERGIVVCNAVGYGSSSVAQHVFALLLELTNNIGLHNRSVQQNGWATSIDWCYSKIPLTELKEKTMGIYGLGKIGQEVAKIALAFGMQVIATRKNPNKSTPPAIQLVNFDRLLKESDVLTLHAPLTKENEQIINATHLSMMKPRAYLINTGRGGLVNELDLKQALLKGTIAGAGLDVLSVEPPPLNHVLLNVPNCFITPHQAWTSKEARARLLEIVADNIKGFLAGNPQNVVS